MPDRVASVDIEATDVAIATLDVNAALLDRGSSSRTIPNAKFRAKQLRPDRNFFFLLDFFSLRDVNSVTQIYTAGHVVMLRDCDTKFFAKSLTVSVLQFSFHFFIFQK